MKFWHVQGLCASIKKLLNPGSRAWLAGAGSLVQRARVQVAALGPSELVVEVELAQRATVAPPGAAALGLGRELQEEPQPGRLYYLCVYDDRSGSRS